MKTNDPEFDKVWDATLFNFQEKQQIEWLVKQVGQLNQKVAQLQLKLNNMKIDIDKERMVRNNAM